MTILKSRSNSLGIIMLLLFTAAQTNAQNKAWPKPIIDTDGTVTVPSYKLPPSVYMSAEAKKALPKDMEDNESGIEQLITNGGIPNLRKDIIRDMTAQINDLKKKHSVTTRDTIIAGIQAIRIIPVNKKLTKEKKLLINLHSGGFLVGSPYSMGLSESIPVAALTGIEVITIQYSQAPEFVFPAASIDVAAVYKTLLKTCKPENIGIYGCSAGGLLTTQAIAWFNKENLPMPAAVGIFSASADASWAGDSWFWQKPLLGMSSPPSLDEHFYYGKYDLNDSLISPVKSVEVLRKFPPTLIIAGTRSPELSAAVNTHRELIKLNIDARLHLWDGLGHVFFTNFDLPESKEAFDVIARFFIEKLKVKDRSKSKR
ncbi:MAG: alpha/beta hydrolase fold domain-containing protein [Proteobacteria bacterium]|nr:alpha/beta hydrolase fold domain-containing protein [Pseudomonadota bacterium]